MVDRCDRELIQNRVLTGFYLQVAGELLAQAETAEPEEQAKLRKDASEYRTKADAMQKTTLFNERFRAYIVPKL